IVAADRGAEIDFALHDAATDRGTNILEAVCRFGLRWESGDLALSHAERDQLLPADIEPHAGLRGLVARPDELLLAGDGSFEKRLVAREQVLLQFVAEAGREILAFRRRLRGFPTPRGPRPVLPNPQSSCAERQPSRRASPILGPPGRHRE